MLVLMSLIKEAQRLVAPYNQEEEAVSNHPLYRLWGAMLSRCNSPTTKGYKDYGGRGIQVCQRWSLPNGEGFRNFLVDMGPRPIGYSVERINVNGDYSPENCRWATRTEQSRNRRSNVAITFMGKTQLLCDWSKELGFAHQGRLSTRIKQFGVEKALSTPKGGRLRRKEGN